MFPSSSCLLLLQPSLFILNSYPPNFLPFLVVYEKHRDVEVTLALIRNNCIIYEVILKKKFSQRTVWKKRKKFKK